MTYKVPGGGQEVRPSDSHAESQSGLNGPSGSPHPSPGRDCLNLFHSQLCSGFGAPTFCPDCGGAWKHQDRTPKKEGA
jgi:hypothetical protein